MLKSLFINTFCVMSCTLNAFQALEETDKASLTYLLWDNSTPATEEDLLADPLLALRAAERYSDHQANLIDAYKRTAKMNFFSTVQELSSNDSLAHFTNRLQKIADTDNSLSLEVTNISNNFYHEKPRFNLAGNTPCDKMWWQISSFPDFSEVISTFDCICAYKSTIVLSDLEETFLDNDSVYYFRARSEKNKLWSPWSDAFAFTISKPKPIVNPHFESDELSEPNIVWETPDRQGQTFLVFGSNSIDFIPNIYSCEQPDAILDGSVIASTPANNFLGETKSTRFTVTADKRFAYYRIIAKSGTSLSKPSQLLPICDGLPAPERDVMVYDAGCADGIFREKFPVGYQWMQKRIHTSESSSTAYVRNPYVSEEIWNMVSPYFLPEHFPEKAVLDRIFSKRRVLTSIKSMYKSGFNVITDSKHKIAVATHPYLKGYIIKAYTDQSDVPEWHWLKRRIDGVIAIQNKITQYGYEGIMKVPKKWLYPLPPEPSPIKGSPHRKNFILIAQEVDILDGKHNRKAYKKKMTPQILDAFYIMLTELHLIDSVYADNTSFCKDGKLAFIDTEHSLTDSMPVPLTAVAQYLSPEMITHWQHLFFNGVQR